MDRFLSQLFRYVPEWMFVLVILGGALYYFMFDTPLYKVCDAQIAEFGKSQKGKLLGRLEPARKKCVSSIRGSGCVEYFEIFESAVKAFPKLEEKCLMQMSEMPFMNQAFSQYMRTMTLLAWGDRPPGTQFEKVGWLAQKDIKTYCKVRELYNLFYPREQWEALVGSTLGLLIEDPTSISHQTRVQRKLSEIDAKDEEDKKEVYFFPKARMKPDKAFDLSLLSLDCLHYM